jgi:hypothetical protein
MKKLGKPLEKAARPMLMDGVNTVISTQMTMGLTRAIGLPALPLRSLWQMVRGVATPQTMQSMTSPIIVIRREALAMAANAAGGKDDDEAIEGSDDDEAIKVA